MHALELHILLAAFVAGLTVSSKIKHLMIAFALISFCKSGPADNGLLIRQDSLAGLVVVLLPHP